MYSDSEYVVSVKYRQNVFIESTPSMKPMERRPSLVPTSFTASNRVAKCFFVKKLG
jgi:hypothetical protein